MSLHEIAASSTPDRTPWDRLAAGEALDRHDLMAIYGLSQAAYYRRAVRGEFDRFKTKPVMGPRCYSGVLVQRHLQGEDLDAAPLAPACGRPRKVAR